MLKSVKFALALFGALTIAATAASAAPLIGTGNPPAGVPGTLELNWTVSPNFNEKHELWVVTGAADYPGAWVPGLAASWLVTIVFAALAFGLAVWISREPAAGDLQ